jgi:hypothetical protein
MSGLAFIGLDDTDVAGSPGTGRIARGLAQHLSDSDLGISLGVTRHQLLVSDEIKYTSHNSSLCFALRLKGPVSGLYQPCIDYLAGRFQQGADPGLCIGFMEQVGDEVIRFGRMAGREVLGKQQAINLAAGNSLFLKELGGSGDGIIGALAAVALRVEGNSGRFVELKGIRQIGGLVSVAELKKRTGIVSVQDAGAGALGDDELIDTLDWVRPSLREGQAVLRVGPASGRAGKRIWLSLEVKKGHNNKKAEAKN